MSPFIAPLVGTFVFAAVGAGVVVAFLADGGGARTPAARAPVQAAATNTTAPLVAIPAAAAASPQAVAPMAPILPTPLPVPLPVALAAAAPFAPSPLPAALATTPAAPRVEVAALHAALQPREPAPLPATPTIAPPLAQPATLAPPTSPVAERPAPDPVAPAAAPATPPPAPARITARICAGSPTGNYTFAAERIAERLRETAGETLEVRVLHSAGSRDNLERLAADTCDIGFSQSDVLALRTAEAAHTLVGLEQFKRVYTEYVHIVCPIASGWTSTAQFGPGTRLIVGPVGSGGAETWRHFVRTVPRFAGVEAVYAPVNLVSVNRVKDSRDTCLLWISGLNSSDMQGANRMSANTPDQRRTMRLIAVTDREILALRGADGQPTYQPATLTPRPGSYDALIQPVVVRNAEGVALTRPAAVSVPTVEAVLVVRTAFLASLPQRGSEVVLAVEDAGPSIWARVSPPVVTAAR